MSGSMEKTCEEVLAAALLPRRMYRRRLLIEFLMLMLVATWLPAAEPPSFPQQIEKARQRLAELRFTCKEKHPAIQEQQRLIGELEIRNRWADDPRRAELEVARYQLAELRKVCKEKHPRILAQEKKVAELEHSMEPSLDKNN